jgi:hypothetical protein
VNRRVVLAGVIGLSTHIFLKTPEAAVTDEKGVPLSLIRLIANPSSFDGRRLRLAGYLDYNGVDSSVGLYVSEIEGRNFLISESIDLKLDDAAAKKLVKRYVILNATFHAPKGNGSEFLNGFLDHISNLKPWNYGDAATAAQP